MVSTVRFVSASLSTQRIFRIGGLAALALLLLAPVASNAQSVRVGEVPQSQMTLAVIDVATGRTLTRIAPGHTLTLEEGQRVILRLEATGRGKALVRPAAQFMTLAGDSRVRLERSTGGSSEAILEAVSLDNASDRDAMTLVGFQAGDSGNGAIAVKVEKAPPLEVASYSIEVWDAFQDTRLRTIQPSGTLEIDAGQRLRLRVEGVSANGKTRRVLPTQYRVLSGQEQILLSQDRDAGWLTIEGNDTNRTEVARVEYEVGNPANVQFQRGVNPRGEIRIAVKDPHSNIGAPTDPAKLVVALYQAILIREPEAGAIDGRARYIAENGFQGLKDQAREIALSPESLQKPRTDTTIQDRLEALYHYLLGIQPKEIPTAESRAFAAMLQNGQIAEVVESMITSDRFLARHKLAQ